MATSLYKLENKVQIHRLQVKRFHMVKILRKSIQYVRRYSTKCAMATSLEESEKNGQDQENSRKYLPFGKKIVKIGAVDTEIALLIVKKRRN